MLIFGQIGEYGWVIVTSLAYISCHKDMYDTTAKCGNGYFRDCYYEWRAATSNQSIILLCTSWHNRRILQALFPNHQHSEVRLSFMPNSDRINLPFEISILDESQIEYLATQTKTCDSLAQINTS